MNMKSRIIRIILPIIISFLMSSCSNQSIPNENKAATTVIDDISEQSVVQTNSTTQKGSVKKREVAQKLLSDFNKLDSLEDGDIQYIFTLQSDRANGILGVYKSYLKDSEIVYVSNKQKELSSVLAKSIIYYGYSKEGVHFIAIAQPLITHNFDYGKAASKIRGNEDEIDVLTDIKDLPKSFFALDIYAEDLLAQKKEFKISVSLSDSMLVSNKVIKPIEKPLDNKLNDLLLKYKRELGGSVMKDKTWMLYLFDTNGISFPEITINYEGEDIKLKN